MAVTISMTITQNSQSVNTCTSDVTVKVTGKWTGGSFNHLSTSGWCKIDGIKYSFSIPKFNPYKTTSGSMTLYTKTFFVEHDLDGTKTVTYSASYTTGLSSGTVTCSASKVLTTIPVTSTLSVANGTLGTAQTLTINKKQGLNKHKLTYSCGGSSYYILGNSTTVSAADSVSWTPPLSLAQHNTAGTSLSISFSLTTYSNNAQHTLGYYIAPSKTFTIPASVKPSCTVSVSDPTGYYSKFGGYVQGKSTLKVAVSATTAYGSPIASYSTTANGTTYTSASFTTAAAKTSGTNTIKATVKDKRGRSGTASKSVTVLAYSAPKITKLTVARCDSNGTANEKGAYAKVTMAASITSLNSKNTSKWTLKYKKTSASSYTSVSVGTANAASLSTSYIFAADTGSSYNVQLVAQDYFGSVTSSTAVSTAYTMMSFSADGTGMAIGKVAETSDVCEFGIPIKPATFQQTTQLYKNTAYGGSWYQGRTRAFLRVVGSPSSTTSYTCLASIKTVDGDWTIGTYNNALRFVYVLDTNYSSSTNTATANAYISTAGAFTDSSDERLKEMFSTDKTKYIELLDHLEPESFCFKGQPEEDRRRSLGYVAQKVLSAMEEVGLEREDFSGLDGDEESYYGISYTQFIPILHAKIKQQEERINKLEKLVEQLISEKEDKE